MQSATCAAEWKMKPFCLLKMLKLQELSRTVIQNQKGGPEKV